MELGGLFQREGTEFVTTWEYFYRKEFTMSIFFLKGHFKKNYF